MDSANLRRSTVVLTFTLSLLGVSVALPLTAAHTSVVLAPSVPELPPSIPDPPPSIPDPPPSIPDPPPSIPDPPRAPAPPPRAPAPQAPAPAPPRAPAPQAPPPEPPRAPAPQAPAPAPPRAVPPTTSDTGRAAAGQQAAREQDDAVGTADVPPAPAGPESTTPDVVLEQSPDNSLESREGLPLEGTASEPAAADTSPTPYPSPDDAAAEAVPRTGPSDPVAPGGNAAAVIALAGGLIALLILIAGGWRRRLPRIHR